jgi:hypothetical protein
MPRDGNDLYSKAAGTTAVANETITSTQFNSTIDDIVEDLNAPRPLSAGGTGATSASTARTALGVAEKQSSKTDTTANRGLIVGGFGIGANAASAGGDLNTAVYTGFYRVETDTASTPEGDGTGPNGSTCIVGRFGTEDGQQIFLSRGSTPNNVRMYVRQMRIETWGAWTEVFTTNSAPLVSTANGYYQQFPSGLMICFHSATFTRSSTTRISYQWTLPAAFVARPVVTATLPQDGTGVYTDLDDRVLLNCQYTASTTAPTVSFVTVSGAASLTVGGNVTNVALMAVGRWA